MIRGIAQPLERQPEAPVDIPKRLELAYFELAEAEQRLAGAGAGTAYALAFENRRSKKLLAETWECKTEELVVQMLALYGLLRANGTLDKNIS